MTDKSQIIKAIDEYIKKNSNFDPHRNYLGISKIAGCPRRAYDEYMTGSPVNESTYRYCFAGYEQERSVLQSLASLLNPAPFEIVAPFDIRLRGHVDAVTKSNELVEVKSVSVRKFETIRIGQRAMRDHYIQCQLYMRYGGFGSAFIIYRCRETYEHLVIPIKYNEHIAEQNEEAAKRILAAIDSQTPPSCTCGRCK
jgi:hypothetical protein